MALSYLRSIDIEPGKAEEQSFYLRRLLIAVMVAKDSFAAREDDPEGLGIGTFEEIRTWLERKQGQA